MSDYNDENNNANSTASATQNNNSQEKGETKAQSNEALRSSNEVNDPRIDSKRQLRKALTNLKSQRRNFDPTKSSPKEKGVAPKVNLKPVKRNPSAKKQATEVPKVDLKATEKTSDSQKQQSSEIPQVDLKAAEKPESSPTITAKQPEPKPGTDKTDSPKISIISDAEQPQASLPENQEKPQPSQIVVKKSSAKISIKSVAKPDKSPANVSTKSPPQGQPTPSQPPSEPVVETPPAPAPTSPKVSIKAVANPTDKKQPQGPKDTTENKPLVSAVKKPDSPASQKKKSKARVVQVRGKSLDEELADPLPEENSSENVFPEIPLPAEDEKKDNLRKPPTVNPLPPTKDEEENISPSAVSNGKADDTGNDSLDFLNNNRKPLSRTSSARRPSRSSSKFLDSLMDQYLDQDYVNKSPKLEKPKASDDDSQRLSRSSSVSSEQGEYKRKKKQPPPPIRNKPQSGSRSWDQPKDSQRREKQWPPTEEPKDIGAYIVESYGQTDPYTKRLIKDIQRAKREEEDRKQTEKRAEIVSSNTQPVDILRDIFTHKPVKSAPGKLKPQVNLNAEKSWIRHEKKAAVYDDTPDEPDWMKLIRNRRWKSTVKARFPCKDSDKAEFDRRSTTPKNWKKLAKDKNALKMLGEIVGIGAEGEELFMRLASQRQKIHDREDRLDMDTFAAQEVLAYQVARESLGEDAAYSLQMDNPLPAARMKQMTSVSSVRSGSVNGSHESIPDLSQDAMLNYPFTTSQLEAAYLSNQLLRLHPEEFRKLISLERSRQATLRWQFSSDPFDSIHEHQDLPYEMALLASDEPRIMQTMRKIVAQGGSDDYRSVFSSAAPTPQPRFRRRSEGAYGNYYTNYESDGYESSNSVSSSSSVGVVRGRPGKKKKPVPLPPHAIPRGRSVSPGIMDQSAMRPQSRSASRSSSRSRVDEMTNFGVTPSGKIVRKTSQSSQRFEDEVQAHSLFDDADLQLENEIANMNKLTSNLSSNIDEELKGIETSLEDRKKGFIVAPSDMGTEVPKTRHRVRRINSNAQLNAVLRKRRQMSDVDAIESQ